MVKTTLNGVVGVHSDLDCVKIMTVENSKLIQYKNNWIIVDKLDNIDDLNQLISQADPKDYSEFTTAMSGSYQRTFFNPSPYWKCNHDLKIPKSWEKIKKKYQNLIVKYLKHHEKFTDHLDKLSIDTAWTVSGKEGSYHTPHEHGLNGISSVIYTKTLNYESPIDNGPIYFILNCDEYQRMPRFVPEEKMILIFPSWIIHGTLPQSDGERTTVNFDFRWD